MHITVAHHQLNLLSERALIVDDATLVLSDTHFGKSASFRARGIPIPEGDTAQDTDRILALAAHHSARRIIIVGDFLHSPDGQTPSILEQLTSFFAQVSCPIDLVLGNHDHRAGRLPGGWPVEIHETLRVGEITFVHDPDDAPDDSFSICGHLHPIARLKDGKNTSFRAPCFWLRSTSLILPSFGTFTGGAVARPVSGDRLFVPVRNQVLEIPESAW